MNNGSAGFKLFDGPIILQKFNNSFDLIEILIEIAETIFFNLIFFLQIFFFMFYRFFFLFLKIFFFFFFLRGEIKV